MGGGGTFSGQALVASSPGKIVNPFSACSLSLCQATSPPSSHDRIKYRLQRTDERQGRTRRRPSLDKVGGCSANWALPVGGLRHPEAPRGRSPVVSASSKTSVAAKSAPSTSLASGGRADGSAHVKFGRGGGGIVVKPSSLSLLSSGQFGACSDASPQILWAAGLQ
ncbi:hypothetical protein LZ31DRAFT_205775 [Colletotrichum somersetense]|nr:hypothetical protein LZ31DRAFT_205775 [Colletotrichum somersetense]